MPKPVKLIAQPDVKLETISKPSPGLSTKSWGTQAPTSNNLANIRAANSFSKNQHKRDDDTVQASTSSDKSILQASETNIQKEEYKQEEDTSSLSPSPSTIVENNSDTRESEFYPLSLGKQLLDKSHRFGISVIAGSSTPNFSVIKHSSTPWSAVPPTNETKEQKVVTQQPPSQWKPSKMDDDAFPDLMMSAENVKLEAQKEKERLKKAKEASSKVQVDGRLVLGLHNSLDAEISLGTFNKSKINSEEDDDERGNKTTTTWQHGIPREAFILIEFGGNLPFLAMGEMEPPPPPPPGLPPPASSSSISSTLYSYSLTPHPPPPPPPPPSSSLTYPPTSTIPTSLSWRHPPDTNYVNPLPPISSRPLLTKPPNISEEEFRRMTLPTSSDEITDKDSSPLEVNYNTDSQISKPSTVATLVETNNISSPLKTIPAPPSASAPPPPPPPPPSPPPPPHAPSPPSATIISPTPSQQQDLNKQSILGEFDDNFRNYNKAEASQNNSSTYDTKTLGTHTSGNLAPFPPDDLTHRYDHHFSPPLAATQSFLHRSKLGIPPPPPPPPPTTPFDSVGVLTRPADPSKPVLGSVQSLHRPLPPPSILGPSLNNKQKESSTLETQELSSSFSEVREISSTTFSPEEESENSKTPAERRKYNFGGFMSKLMKERKVDEETRITDFTKLTPSNISDLIEPVENDDSSNTTENNMNNQITKPNNQDSRPSSVSLKSNTNKDSYKNINSLQNLELFPARNQETTYEKGIENQTSRCNTTHDSSKLSTSQFHESATSFPNIPETSSPSILPHHPLLPPSKPRSNSRSTIAKSRNNTSIHSDTNVDTLCNSDDTDKSLPQNIEETKSDIKISASTSTPSVTSGTQYSNNLKQIEFRDSAEHFVVSNYKSEQTSETSTSSPSLGFAQEQVSSTLKGSSNNSAPQPTSPSTTHASQNQMTLEETKPISAPREDTTPPTVERGTLQDSKGNNIRLHSWQRPGMESKSWRKSPSPRSSAFNSQTLDESSRGNTSHIGSTPVASSQGFSTTHEPPVSNSVTDSDILPRVRTSPNSKPLLPLGNIHEAKSTSTQSPVQVKSDTTVAGASSFHRAVDTPEDVSMSNSPVHKQTPHQNCTSTRLTKTHTTHRQSDIIIEDLNSHYLKSSKKIPQNTISQTNTAQPATSPPHKGSSQPNPLKHSTPGKGTSNQKLNNTYSPSQPPPILPSNTQHRSHEDFKSNLKVSSPHPPQTLIKHNDSVHSSRGPFPSKRKDNSHQDPPHPSSSVGKTFSQNSPLLTNISNTSTNLTEDRLGPNKHNNQPSQAANTRSLPHYQSKRKDTTSSSKPSRPNTPKITSQVNPQPSDDNDTEHHQISDQNESVEHMKKNETPDSTSVQFKSKSESEESKKTASPATQYTSPGFKSIASPSVQSKRVQPQPVKQSPSSPGLDLKGEVTSTNPTSPLKSSNLDDINNKVNTPGISSVSGPSVRLPPVEHLINSATNGSFVINNTVTSNSNLAPKGNNNSNEDNQFSSDTSLPNSSTSHATSTNRGSTAMHFNSSLSALISSPPLLVSSSISQHVNNISSSSVPQQSGNISENLSVGFYESPPHHQEEYYYNTHPSFHHAALLQAPLAHHNIHHEHTPQQHQQLYYHHHHHGIQHHHHHPQYPYPTGHTGAHSNQPLYTLPLQHSNPLPPNNSPTGQHDMSSHPLMSSSLLPSPNSSQSLYHPSLHHTTQHHPPPPHQPSPPSPTLSSSSTPLISSAPSPNTSKTNISSQMLPNTQSHPSFQKPPLMYLHSFETVQQPSHPQPPTNQQLVQPSHIHHQSSPTASTPTINTLNITSSIHPTTSTASSTSSTPTTSGSNSSLNNNLSAQSTPLPDDYTPPPPSTLVHVNSSSSLKASSPSLHPQQHPSIIHTSTPNTPNVSTSINNNNSNPPLVPQQHHSQPHLTTHHTQHLHPQFQPTPAMHHPHLPHHHPFHIGPSHIPHHPSLSHHPSIQPYPPSIQNSSASSGHLHSPPLSSPPPSIHPSWTQQHTQVYPPLQQQHPLSHHYAHLPSTHPHNAHPPPISISQQQQQHHLYHQQQHSSIMSLGNNYTNNNNTTHSTSNSTSNASPLTPPTMSIPSHPQHYNLDSQPNTTPNTPNTNSLLNSLDSSSIHPHTSTAFIQHTQTLPPANFTIPPNLPQQSHQGTTQTQQSMHTQHTPQQHSHLHLPQQPTISTQQHHPQHSQPQPQPPQHHMQIPQHPQTFMSHPSDSEQHVHFPPHPSHNASSFSTPQTTILHSTNNSILPQQSQPQHSLPSYLTPQRLALNKSFPLGQPENTVATSHYPFWNGQPNSNITPEIRAIWGSDVSQPIENDNNPHTYMNTSNK